MAGQTFASLTVRLHREGYPFVAAFAGVTLFLFWLWAPLGFAGLVLTVWCYYFFRDPDRVTPDRAGLVISPADGIVSMIEPAAPPPELGMGSTPLTRISIFMDVFNCHVNRAPLPGVVEKVAYRPGKFLNASLDKASEDNERNGLVLRIPDGRLVGVVQIAGLVARRIVCWTEAGRSLQAGERFGMIRFGSRVDVYLPEGVAPLAVRGQKAVAGETVLADLTTDEAQRTGMVR